MPAADPAGAREGDTFMAVMMRSMLEVADNSGALSANALCHDAPTPNKAPATDPAARPRMMIPSADELVAKAQL